MFIHEKILSEGFLVQLRKSRGDCQSEIDIPG